MLDVKTLSQGRWLEILPKLGVDASLLDGQHHAFPEIGCNTDGFRFIDKQGDGYCSLGAGEFGTGFDLLMKLNGWDFAKAASEIEGVMGWSNSDYIPPTKEESAANAAKHEKAAAERTKALAEQHQMAVIRAQGVWDSSTPASNEHAYLKAKQVKAYGINLDGEYLLIPVRIGDNITSIQRIKPDGSKLFHKGGEISGGYHSIVGAGAADMSRIYIAEGYATAATVREATGCHVAVAFNAGNLGNVAKAIRSKLPDIQIIIAGDNDESKTGETRGKAAADSVGGLFVMPPDVGNDWNDYAATHGLEAVGDKIGKQIKEAEKLPCPLGYSCSKSGVFVEHEDKDPERLTHRAVWVSALSRDGSMDNWGRLVCWIDHDGHQHERALPAGIFHASGNELAQELATAGLPIVPSKERRLLQYLAAFTPETRLTAATATGWHGDSFVMPDKTINEPANERIIYQPSEYRDTNCMGKSGTLEGWRNMVRDVSPLVKFAIAASLSSPLRLLTNTAAGGYHYYGRTSLGKTIILQVGCSVWGNGADPAMAGGADVYIQRWNATKNGLEGMAASFNDLPLVIDEIGESDGRDFGRIVYQLMSGTGKARANRNGGLSKCRTWRITLLSSGELPVSDFIDGAKGGQLVRLIDIEAVDLFKDRIDADAMKLGCAKNYGHAGIALLKSGDLLDGFDSIQADDIGDAPTPESGRVRDRFRLVAHAGELAIRRGILPWAAGDVLDCCKQVFNSWMASGNGMSDADRGIENVRNFILAYGQSRFEYDDDRKREPTDRAGSYHGGCYNFTSPAFKEACGGVLDGTVKKALYDAGLLHASEAGKLVGKATIGGKRTRAVCVKDDILSEVVKTTGAIGAAGAKPYTATPKACPPQQGRQGRIGADESEMPTAPTLPTAIGAAKNVANKGLAPTAHHAHHKNSTLEKMPANSESLRPVNGRVSGVI